MLSPRRKDLIDAVSQVQNMLECPIDILTFCAWKGVTDAEVETHLEHYIRRVQDETNAKIKIRKSRSRRKAS